MKQNWIKKYKQPDPRGIEPPTGNRIGNLDDSIPFTTDPISQGDDHIRATKRALQGSFPVIGDSPVTLTAPQLNHSYNRFAIGMMMYFDDTLGPIPFGWAICDGNLYNGYQTIDLRSYFIKANGENAVGFLGGNDTHPVPAPVELTEAQMPRHNHSSTIPWSDGDGDVGTGSGRAVGLNPQDTTWTSTTYGGNASGGSDPHNHEITPFDNQPAYITLTMIVFVGFEPPTP